MKCKYCGKEFENERGVTAHIWVKHKEQATDDFNKSKVKVSGVELDITNSELNKIRENHPNRCEICGKYETANTRPDAKETPNNLCIDHNHNTNKFRVFICVQCNRNMGWLDKYKKQITAYNKPYKSKVKK